MKKKNEISSRVRGEKNELILESMHSGELESGNFGVID